MVEQGNAIFLHPDVRKIFSNKTVVVLGDSIQRSVYKDLVCLWCDPSSRYLTESELRAKGELSFLKDKLLLGGQLGERVNGVQYKEVRDFREQNTVFRFYFITRCFDDYVQSVLNEFKTLKPDIIIMNSCYWDVHHYGEEGMKKYPDNLEKLFSSIYDLPSHPLLVWNSALPLAEQCKGGFLRQGFKTLPRHHVLWANDVAHDLIRIYRFVYIDLFFTLDGNLFFSQAEDGIHWGKRAHRKISNLILDAVCRRLRLPVGGQLNLAPNFAFPERFVEDSWQEYQFPDFDPLERNLNPRQERYRPPPLPKPLLGLDTQHNFMPLNFNTFFTPPPPPPPPIARYLDAWPRELTPPRIDVYLPRFEHPRYFSEPLPWRKLKVPMINHYKKRFAKIKQVNTPNTNHAQTKAPGTPLSTQSNAATTASENTVNNTETVSSISTPSSSTSKVGEIDSVSEGNKDNVENIDVTNNQGAKPPQKTRADANASRDEEAVGTKKRKREEEDVEPCPPVKQGKQLDGTPVKCQIRYDSFL